MNILGPFAQLVAALRHDSKGSSLPFVAGSFMLLISASALGVDAMNAFTTKERLQKAADSAATSAAMALPDLDTSRTAALLFAERNRPQQAASAILSNEAIEFGTWDSVTRTFSPSASGVNAARVVTSMTREGGNALPTWFARVFGVTTIDISATAIAVRGDGQPCLLALNPTMEQAIELNSNASLDLTDCEVHARSTSSRALYTDSAASGEADRFCVAGGHDRKSNSYVSPAADTGCSASSDPFASMEPPAEADDPCDYNGFALDDAIQTIQPGVYCGGLEINGNSQVTFAPGIYVIRDGKLYIDGNSVVSGSEVGFYLTGTDATIEFNSNTEVSFSAPASGDMAGMLIFQDRDFGGTHVWDSNTIGQVDGAIYLPKGRFETNSNTYLGQNSSCLMLVADSFYFDSNSGVVMDADYENCPFNHSSSTLVRLVR